MGYQAGEESKRLNPRAKKIAALELGVCLSATQQLRADMYCHNKRAMSAVLKIHVSANSMKISKRRYAHPCHK